MVIKENKYKNIIVLFFMMIENQITNFWFHQWTENKYIR